MPTRSGAAAPAVLRAASAARLACARICRASTRNTTPGAVSATWWVLRSSEADAELALEPLHLLAQRRLDDVLPLGRPAEVQLLRQGHEVAKLP